jgi:hypothetical protein
VNGSPHDAGRQRVTASYLAVVAAALLALLGFLPISSWLAGGHEAAGYEASKLGEWLNGSAIAIGLGVVLEILSRRIPSLWREGAWQRLADRASRRPVASTLVISALALALYSLVALTVFDGRPLFLDEIGQFYQAQTFAAGRLWRPAAPHPEFFDVLQVVVHRGRVFAQFPPGAPAVLTAGILAGVPWLVNPLCGALTVLAFAAFLRVAEPRPGVALAATLLLAFAPFAFFMAGSYMNHVPALLCLVLSIAALARVTTAPTPRPLLALANGLALGAAATIRPVDAIAFALPAAAWYLALAIRDRRRWVDAILSGVGVAIPIALLIGYNLATTGRPLLFGYQLLWGSSHDLGFHAAPWGAVHTPARGLELVNLYALRLQTYLFESPIPSLLPAIAALALTRSLSALDRYLLACGALLVGLYFAYWHDGFYLGPRFVYALLPLLALWTARFPSRLRAAIGSGAAYRTALYSLGVSAIIALLLAVPLRAHEYGARYATMREDVAATARAAGARDALILVRESWGSQLVSRLLALGVTQGEVELLYPRVDACQLELGIARLERTPPPPAAVFDALRPLLADSARVVRSHLSADDSERLLPGAGYPPRCQRRLADDSAGFTLYAPASLVNADGNVYARDLHARDSLLLRAFPGRPVYLLRRVAVDSLGAARLFRVDMDSARSSWLSEQ